METIQVRAYTKDRIRINTFAAGLETDQAEIINQALNAWEKEQLTKSTKQDSDQR